MAADDDLSKVPIEHLDASTLEELKGIYDNLSKIMRLHKVPE